MDCIFCALTEKKIPALIVHEDDQTLAFLDLHPLSDGHTVVIPKHHAERMKDLPEAYAAALGLTIRRVSDILHASLQPAGITIGINDGEGAHQGIPHVHAHLIPRHTSDGGGSLHSIVTAKQLSPREEIAKRMRVAAEH